MASNGNPSRNPQSSSLYPQVVSSSTPDFTSQQPHSSLYPSLDSDNAASFQDAPPSPPPSSSEDLLLRVPGAVVHLIDKTQSVELAYGDLDLVRLVQNGATVAVFARIGDQIQWPLAKDEPAVKLDTSHYFFSLRVPPDFDSQTNPDTMLNYGLTLPAKGQEQVLSQFDRILGDYSNFSVEKLKSVEPWWRVAEDTSPGEMVVKRGQVEDSAAAYWTTLAPNVEDYSNGVARAIAAGSGRLVQGILWCGDMTVERLKWGNEFLRNKMDKKEVSQVSPQAMQRIQRVKKVTGKSEEIAAGILSGVVKVTGYVTGAIVNSKPGRKFFSIPPGEIVLASLDGFNKVWDAIEVAGKNVLSTSSVVTTELVSERYGEHAAKATNEGMGAAGHAVGTAWAVLKIRKAINPRSVIKPTALAKAASRTTSDAAGTSLKKDT